MIISASRRTDIPAFYGQWLYNRVLDKKVLVPNPYNPAQLSEISLDLQDVDCFVFWTKNPEPFFPYFSKIEAAGYPSYFQFTLTAYGQDVEPLVPRKKQLLHTFKNLSLLIGKERIIWRYDPVLINDVYSVSYHIKWFSYLCSQLADYCNKCVISFLDTYSYIKPALVQQHIRGPNIVEQVELAKQLLAEASAHGLILSACCESPALQQAGISNNRCVDNELVEQITGRTIPYKQDTGQRKGCSCHSSRDIGVYSTCRHDCIYCYADRQRGCNSRASHDPQAPHLH